MRVYRCISAREITNMYKAENERNAIVEGQNTHKYEKDENYIHFFRYSQSAESFKKNTGIGSINPQDRYVMFMTANIPNEILDKYIGYGIYNSSNTGAEIYEVKHPGYIPLPEYAIPESEFKKDYIVELNSYIDYKFKSDSKQYGKYILLLDVLYEKFKDYNKVCKYLKENNLQKLLNVKDDNRTEKEIVNDEFEKMKEIFSKDDFLK